MKEKKNEEKISILLEDLSSLESYARDLFSFLPLSVCFISPIGVILEANLSFSKISGYKIDDLIGRPVEDIFDQKEMKELLKETSDKGFAENKEINIFTKEKRKIPVSVSTRLRKSGEEEIIGYFIGFFDLTEIKKNESALRDSQSALLNILEDVEEARKRIEEEANKTSTIITNFADGLLVFDEENKLSMVNPQAENFFDIKTGDIIGRSVPELRAFPAFESLVVLLGEEVKGIFRKELPIRGNLILEVSTLPLVGGEERLGTLVILHDITREKMIERMKTEFVSLAAHQLRTPLSAIKWTLKMILDGDLGKITDEQKDFLEKTYSSNERMISLINDLLNITRIEEGRYLYKPVLTEITPLIQFAINSYNEEIEKKKIKFQFKKPEEKLPKIKLDVEKIKLALDNLIDNAIRYTPISGEIMIALGYEKGELKFSIKDKGAGIPKDQEERIFTKFFRGANVIRMETEGTGLGLFITKNIIEAHGGKIWFESEEEKGTTFYFTLPVKEESGEFLKEP